MTRRRFLVVTRRALDPVIGGSGMRVRHNVQALSSVGDVRVLTFSQNAADARQRRGLGKWPVLLSAPGVPGWARRFLVNDAHQVLEETLSAWRPHCIVFEETNLAPLAELASKFDIPLVYSSHNLEMQNDERLVGGTGGGKLICTAKRFFLTIAEQFLLDRVSAVWVCSEREKQILSRSGRAKGDVFVVPNGIDVQAYDYDPAPERVPHKPQMIYPASFDYGPNLEAAVFLLESVLPSVAMEFPDVRLSLVGDAPPKWLRRKAASIPGAELTGRVRSVMSYLKQSDVMPVPIVHGGGTRLKILEGFAAGVPVVTTPKGAENLLVEHGRHCVVESLEGIAEGVKSVLRSKELACNLRENGRRLVESDFSIRKVTLAVEQAVRIQLDGGIHGAG